MGLTKLAALLLAGLSSSLQAGEIAVVTNQNSDDVSLIDLEERRETARIAIGGKPAGVDVSTGTAFIVSPDSKTLTRLDPVSGEITGRLQLDGGPLGVAVGGGHVFVSDFYNARIWVIDPEAMEVETTLETAAAPAGLETTGSYLVSADRDADAVSIFALDGLRPLHRIGVGAHPFGLSADPETGLVHVANVGSDNLTVLDPESGEVVRTVKTGPRPYGITFAGGRGFVSDQYGDTVTVFDPGTGERLGRIAVGEYPEGIDVSADGRLVYVANWFSNTLSIIDAETLEVIGEIDTGDGPRAFGRFIVETDESD